LSPCNRNKNEKGCNANLIFNTDERCCAARYLRAPQMKMDMPAPDNPGSSEKVGGLFV
jgi:hypothetical protein